MEFVARLADAAKRRAFSFLRPALGHLMPLGILNGSGRVETAGTRAVAEPRLWLVDYGEWTGFASATVIGVARSAKATAEEVTACLKAPHVPAFQR